MTKVYLVKDAYIGADTIIGVCPDRKLAEMLVQKSRNLHDLENNEITSDIWSRMAVACKETPDWPSKTMCEILFELFPEYSVKDIEEAYYYYTHRSYHYTYIEEIDMFTNESDILLYGNNA